MSIQVVMLKSLEEKLKNKRYASHLLRIDKLRIKLERMGNNALKFLDMEGEFMLSEMKLHEPPYRLYVVLDQDTGVYYLVELARKSDQDETIAGLRRKIADSVRFGFDKVFT